MFFKAVFSAAFLAVCVNAAPVADPAKTFKFLVDDPTKGKYYLADKGAGTQDISKALTCELTADVIKCGGKGFPGYSGDMTKLAPGATASTGWSIDADGGIHWSAASNMKFSLGINGGTDVWAETCPHHWQTHGTAKAVYDAATPAA
ncbi:hypothetical protein B0T24DRAFT_707919 [Lasiosphaeria ovina]|uniref:AA1-like domain-containing protein n=1 Tax=Lasiosphaeria ovina TaxID=92902 RepID=A0AAE0N3G8_9PEZI|nr:hypothetical protein B0T24DRAFT_707919 [Lasiosphaeria ovina]